MKACGKQRGWGPVPTQSPCLQMTEADALHQSVCGCFQRLGKFAAGKSALIVF